MAGMHQDRCDKGRTERLAHWPWCNTCRLAHLCGFRSENGLVGRGDTDDDDLSLFYRLSNESLIGRNALPSFDLWRKRTNKRLGFEFSSNQR